MDDAVDDVVDDLPGDERGVVFDGPVQTADDVGEQLCKHYDAVEPYESDG